MVAMVAVVVGGVLDKQKYGEREREPQQSKDHVSTAPRPKKKNRATVETKTVQ